MKRLTVNKVIDMADFLSDMGLYFNGSAEDTLLHLNRATFTADILGDSARTICLWAVIDSFDGGTLFSYGS